MTIIIKFGIIVLLVCVASIDSKLRRERSFPADSGYPDNSNNDAADQTNSAANSISADYGSAVNNVGQVVENIQYVDPDSEYEYPCD